MGLFDKMGSAPKKPALRFEEDDNTLEPTGYNQVIDYLVGLSDEDFQKVLKVAEIYRKANADALEALEIENKPTTFIIDPDADIAEEDTDDFLDDEMESAFFEDIEDDSKKPKGKKHS